MQRKIVGIYCIENLVNKKKYIGKSVDVLYRIVGHKRDLRKNIHFNSYLQFSWNKYGEKAFNFYILEECERENLSNREIYLIKKYATRSSANGYNLTNGGEGVLGLKRSEESKNKAALSNRGKTRSDESKRKMSESAKGKHRTAKEKENLSVATRYKQKGNRIQKNKSSKYLGVFKKKNRSNFTAQITYGQHVFHLGNYSNEIDAAREYDFVAFFLYSDVAILNFPEEYGLL